MKKTLKNILLGTAIPLLSLTNLANAAYPDVEFTTDGFNLSQIKRGLRQNKETFDRFAEPDERADLDGDGTTEISIVYTKKDKEGKSKRYYVSSRDYKEGKIDSNHWKWYFAE